MTTYRRLVIAWLQQRGLETIFVCQREPKLHFDQPIIPKSLFNNGVGIFGDQEQKSENLLYQYVAAENKFLRWSLELFRGSNCDHRCR